MTHGVRSARQSSDVLYLTNHYSQQPYAGDEAGIGEGRSHGVVVLPVDGPAYLVADTTYWRPDLAVYDEVIVSTHVPTAAAEALRLAGLEGGRVALTGVSYMSAAAYLGLRSQSPTTRFERRDRIVEELRVRKSAAAWRSASARQNQPRQMIRVGARPNDQ